MIIKLAIYTFPFMFLIGVYFTFKILNKRLLRAKQAELRRKCKIEKTQGDSIAKEWNKNKAVIDEGAAMIDLSEDQEISEVKA